MSVGGFLEPAIEEFSAQVSSDLRTIDAPQVDLDESAKRAEMLSVYIDHLQQTPTAEIASRGEV